MNTAHTDVKAAAARPAFTPARGRGAAAPRRAGLARAVPVILMVVICAAVATGCAGSRSQQSTGELVDDTVITTKVQTALIRDDEVEAMDIEIKTFKGVVQLSGFADSDRERQRADQIAARVAGVERVQNDIRIKRSN